MKSEELLKMCEGSAETFKDYVKNVEPVLRKYAESEITVTESEHAVTVVMFRPKANYVNDIEKMTRDIMEEINRPFISPVSIDLYELVRSYINSFVYDNNLGNSYVLTISNRDFEADGIN